MIVSNRQGFFRVV